MEVVEVVTRVERENSQRERTWRFKVGLGSWWVALVRQRGYI